MAIGPMDIHHKEFSTVRMGGYNKEDVDAFLDQVADELDRLLHRSQEQAELLESMRQKASQYDTMQQTLQNALINAQKSADSIVLESKVQAEAQIKEAREQSLRILEEAQSEGTRISQSFEGVREQARAYLGTMRELLENNLAMIKEYEARLRSRELKGQPAPVAEPAVAVEPEPADVHIPEFRAPAGLEVEAAGKREDMRLPHEEEPAFTTWGEAAPPQGPPAQTAFASPPAEPLPEPSAPREAYAEHAVSQEPGEAPPPPPPPVYSTEQEMEALRESLMAETPPAPPPADEPRPRAYPREPAPRPEDTSEEKHFFWE